MTHFDLSRIFYVIVTPQKKNFFKDFFDHPKFFYKFLEI